MIAITRRIWIKPPSVNEVTIPRSQRTRRIIAIVINIKLLLRLKILIINEILDYSFCVDTLESD